MVILVGVLLRVNIVPFVATQPNWWTWCVDNRLYTCVVIFFLGNSVENMLMSTGAFEIMFNGEEVACRVKWHACGSSFHLPDKPSQFTYRCSRVVKAGDGKNPTTARTVPDHRQHVAVSDESGVQARRSQVRWRHTRKFVKSTP